MNPWLNHHLAAAHSASRRLLNTPLNTLLSLFVIGIALALPAAGHLLLDNLRHLTHNLNSRPQISLFLAVEASPAAVSEIERRLKAERGINWRFISRDEALTRLQRSEGLAEIVDSLPRNPLPDAFIVEPEQADPETLAAAASRYGSWPLVAQVQLDSAWVRRLDALLRIANLVVNVLGMVFAMALVAIIFNTIRLQVLAQGREIEVARLIGATDGWIRRPFQYYGALQGVLGGLFAASLLAVGFAELATPVGELVQLYGSDFSLRGPSLLETLAVAGAGGLLGWLGAQLSVGLYLHRLGRDHAG